jgi:pimeloyl-ACP methyl ester carboxylesterase
MQNLQSQLSVVANGTSSSEPFVLPPPSDAINAFVTVYGAKIHYLEVGCGPTVLLLHGLGIDSSAWAMNIGPLSRKYRVIVPDQIGSGCSDKPFLNYRVSTLVDFLEGFYKELNIERASLVGSSLSSWVAAAFALANPEKVERLILLNPFAVLEDTEPCSLDVLNPSTREGIRQFLLRAFYNKELFGSDATVDLFFTRKIMAGDGYTVQQFLESFARREDVLDNQLHALKQPTLIIAGREDGIAPLPIAQWYNKEIPNSQLLVIEQSGHGVQFEKPDEFNAAVMNFF